MARLLGSAIPSVCSLSAAPSSYKILSSLTLIMVLMIISADSSSEYQSFYHQQQPALSGPQISQILNEKLRDYDKRVRPNQGGNPVEVEISLYALKLYDYSNLNNDFKIDCYFRQKWIDPRLQFAPPTSSSSSSPYNPRNVHNPNAGKILAGNDLLSRIWVPDTFFPSDKNGFRSSLTVPNIFVSISSNGTVFSSQRLTTHTDCEGGLGFFPMERHVCELEIESYGYSASEIVYRWKGDQVGDRIGVGIELPSFDLVSVSDFESQIMLTTGNYSRIGVRFVIDRKLAGYIWRIYLPAILMVVSSFVPFYLKKSSSVHRIFISSLSFVSLIFITLLTAVSFTPKSGSLTTLDIFLFVSSSFSFICMILISLITTCHVSSSSKTRDSIGRAEQNNLNNAIADDKNEDGSEDDSYTEKGKTLDQIGKFIMPLLFLVFNAFYWLVSVIFPAAILG